MIGAFNDMHIIPPFKTILKEAKKFKHRKTCPRLGETISLISNQNVHFKTMEY